MRKILFRLIISLLAFSIGVATTVIADLPLALLFSLLILLLIPSLIIGTVVYQGAFLKNEWRPAIGKGFLAIFLWLIPSSIVVLLNLFYWLVGLHREPLFGETWMLRLIVSSLTSAYGLTGLGLYLWVRRYDSGNHWLLNNRMQ